MDQKYLTDSESLSLNIVATCLLLSSPRNFQYEIKTDKYNPYPSIISMFTSDSQHPPKSRHAVHLGVYGNYTVKQGTTLCTVKLFIQLMYNKNDHLAKWSIFVRYSMSSFAYTNPSPPPPPTRPKTPFTYVIYLHSDI